MNPPPFVIDSNHPWRGGNTYRNHNIARQLAKRTDVLWVDPPSPFSLSHRWWTGDPEGINVFRPRRLPGHGRFTTVTRRADAVLQWQFRRAMRQWEGVTERPVVFSANAWNLFLFDLGSRLTVFHYSDDFREFFPEPFRSRYVVREEEFLRRAGLVVATVPHLLERALSFNPSARLLPHGVDPIFFREAVEGLPLPADLGSIPDPRVGYTGLLDRFFDAGLLRTVAQDLPSVSFVLIGPRRDECPGIEALLALPNVHYLGPRPWRTLPSYLAGFRAAIVPFCVNDWVAAFSHPVKIYEYLAAGLPVVSSPVWVEESLRDHVAWAKTPAVFAEMVRAAVQPSEGPRRYPEIMRECSWDRRVDLLLSWVDGVAGP